MAQENYDQGYADGRASRQSEIDLLESQIAGLEAMYAEVRRLRGALAHPVQLVGAGDDVPY